MYNEYAYFVEDLLEGVFSFGGVGSSLNIVAYVLASLALYTIAKSRGIRKAWLAWMPVLNVWILGSISDQYRYVVKGQIKSRRKVLLVAALGGMVCGCLASIRIGSVLINLISGMLYNPGNASMAQIIYSNLFKALFLLVPVMVFGLIKGIFELLALYDVYASCDPENKVLYFVLSLIPGLSGVTKPLLLFLCRDKEAGMPPRKEPDAPKTPGDNEDEMDPKDYWEDPSA